ncbi:hypothetical protein SAMN04487949_2928 [Halogranum gelatinilyticum]|uniref:Glycosyltransferase RgtA/B/C/D-like domain-containing protein n=1 Tax=Halogranum gelatinilyticum TaxID=660521 RepID=A0A1G9XC27_9EURY|nr:hypothetical protein [Halogranum gelatinilyticum]SDM94310.1 hypothetical protein SAMN04487949_2928 [Halogranum gelatinilyticum]
MARTPLSDDGSETTSTRLFRAVFGDEYGLLLFLGAFAFFGLSWRLGVLVNDNYTLANALYNLANGHLAVVDVVYGPESGATPGMVSSNGTRYGRNYGQLVVSLPVVYALRGLALVADLRLVVVGLWSASLLGFGWLAGRVVGRETLGAVVGSTVALVAFGFNVAVATDLPTRWASLLALQITSMAAAALTAVLLYRLLTRLHDRRVGIAAGAAVALATPVGFWATVPKRHTYVAMLVLATVYGFYRSRAAVEPAEARRFRALTYAVVGLTAWVQAAEAFVLFVALVVVDLATAASNSRRDLGVVGVAFGLSLLPFMLTNLLVAGNPFQPPRLLPRFQPGDSVSATGNHGLGVDPSGGSDGGQAAGEGSSTGWRRVVGLVERSTLEAVSQVGRLGGYLGQGIGAALEADRLYRVFVRGGYLESVASRDGGRAINLSVLESAPLFAALVVLPRAVLAWIRDHRSTGRRDAVVATDWFVAVFSLLFTVFYIHRLPLHAMITVRYLVPMMPLLVYGVARLAAVRDLLESPWTVGFAYGLTVLVGSQLLLAVFVVEDVTLGEAVQVHAWLNLAAAGGLAAWLVFEKRLPDRVAPVGSGLLGVVAGVTTNFLLLSGLFYFALPDGFVLPVVETVNELTTWL